MIKVILNYINNTFGDRGAVITYSCFTAGVFVCARVYKCACACICVFAYACACVYVCA